MAARTIVNALVNTHDPQYSRLFASHRVALAHVLELVRHREAVSSSYIAEVLDRAGSDIAGYDAAMECVRVHARVVIHFHPDRFGTTAIPVAEALLEEGVYRNQFETGLSTGGLSAFPGGARDSWERSLFGGAYHASGVIDSERPKYGALELVRYADGPIPRFGSCHHPDAWRDWGSRAEVLQHLKQLWHVLVHYGAPAFRTPDRPPEID